MGRNQRTTSGDLDPEEVRAMLNAPSASTHQERFEFLTDTLFQNMLTTIPNNSVITPVDVSNRLLVGNCLACGAQADVLEGRLLESHIDNTAIQPILMDKGAFGVYLKQHPMTFKTVAVKQPRFYRFLEDRDGAIKVRVCPYQFRGC